MTSGQMWNHIRGPPYAHKNPHTGQVVSVAFTFFSVFLQNNADTVQILLLVSLFVSETNPPAVSKANQLVLYRCCISNGEGM